MLNTKSLCGTIALTSIAMVVNPGVSGIRIVMPFTNLYFHFWEVPLLLVFLLFGLRFGALAATMNALFLLAYFPGPSSPFYAAASIVAATCTMLGTYAGQKLLFKGNYGNSKIKTYLKLLGFVLLLRIPVMAFVNYLILAYAYGAPLFWVVNIQLPLQAVYNVILISYTIPISIVVSRKIKIFWDSKALLL